ncbi:MAG: 4-hydroxy-tetrahydrodipicolinate reductase [Myxococcaceae bacterium]
MINTVVTGITGRMGSTLVRLVRDDADMKLSGATERAGSGAVGLDAGLATKLGALEVPVVDSLSRALDKAAVVIDFTSAEASLEHARICAEKNVPLVVGSTGFSAAAKYEMAVFGQKIPIVMAPNMSVGVNLVIQVAGHLAKTLGEAFDVEIVETHHKMKKDAPSGTALRLAEEIASTTKRSSKDFVMERHGQIGERTRSEIGIQTLRGGDVVGEHTVYFFGEGERVELTHRATSRDQFGRGALRAAKWVVGKPPGVYDMMDVLGLKAQKP